MYLILKRKNSKVYLILEFLGFGLQQLKFLSGLLCSPASTRGGSRNRNNFLQKLFVGFKIASKKGYEWIPCLWILHITYLWRSRWWGSEKQMTKREYKLPCGASPERRAEWGQLRSPLPRAWSTPGRRQRARRRSSWSSSPFPLSVPPWSVAQSPQMM